MAKNPPNVATGSGSIPARKPKTTPKKTTPKTPGKTGGARAPKTGLYSWNGGPATHSISADQHAANVIGAGAGLPPGTLPAGLTDDLSTAGAYGLAKVLAAQQYAPQIQANQSLQQSVPSWFQNYQADVQALRTGPQGLATQAAPALATAQQAVTNTGNQRTPGLDPNSPQAAQDAQAAQGRAALAQLGADSLNGVVSAGDAYLAGMQGVAARDLPAVQQQLVTQGGQLKSQQGYATAQNYNTLRTGQQNYGLAQATLGANVANQQADNAVAQQNANTQATSVKNTAKNNAAKQKAAAAAPNKYGIPTAQWNSWSSSHRQRVIDKFDAKTGSSKGAADAAKQKAAIQKASGAVQNQIQNVISQWDGYVGQETDDTSKPKLPDGSYPPRKLTPTDIKKILGQKYDSGMIHAALLIRANKPLDQAAIDYLHHKDPNIRIPRKWLPASSRSGAVTDTTPSNTLNRPGAS